MAALETGNDCGHFFRARASVGVADHDAADLLRCALRDELMQIVEALLVKLRLAGDPVFPSAAGCVHGVFQIDNDFEAVVLQLRDGFGSHPQSVFGSAFERARYIEEPGFDDHNSDRDALPVTEHELKIGPLFDSCAAPSCPAEESQLHRSRIDRSQSEGQVADKLVCACESDLGVVNAKGRHPLQEPDGVGHGDLNIGLLQAIAEAGVEELYPSRAWSRAYLVQNANSQP
jgi:hypothetical protein